MPKFRLILKRTVVQDAEVLVELPFETASQLEGLDADYTLYQDADWVPCSNGGVVIEQAYIQQ